MASHLRSAFQQQKHHRHALTLAAAATASATAASVTLLGGDSAPPAHWPWRHTGWFSAFDHAALRRGFQVYREVCATCHSLEYIRWRELVGVTHTKPEVAALAKDVMIMDGPNREGEMYERPSKPYDQLPSPYENEEQGAAANNGAYPPDLSLMVKARHEGHDYIMSLLTGYMDKPEGKDMMEGLYYNPYFLGGGIAMPPPLQDEGVEYPDGTVATISQQARDVVQFLHWSSDPKTEERKQSAALWYFGLICFALGSGFHKRWKWSPIKTRRIAYIKGM